MRDMTHLKNGSYFFISSKSQYWLLKENEKPKRRNSKGHIRAFLTKQPKNWDRIFSLDFDQHCQDKEETVYGIRVINKRRVTLL